MIFRALLLALLLPLVSMLPGEAQTADTTVIRVIRTIRHDSIVARIDTVWRVQVDTLVRVDTLAAPLPDSAATEPPAAPPPPPASGNLTPAELQAVVGPLVRRDAATQTGAAKQYDSNFQNGVPWDGTGSEQYVYNAWLGMADRYAAAVAGNYWGGLRGRIMWAIRNGLPYGPSASGSSVYGHGRQIVRDYLNLYSKPSTYATQPHHNTGMPDVELLYLLEGDKEAYDHIHVTAMAMTWDEYNYLKSGYTGPGQSDPRAMSVALQAFHAAHRIGIPFARSDANTGTGFDPSPGSWLAAGTRQINEWLAQGFPADGGFVSTDPADGGVNYIMPTMLTQELLRWYGYVDPNPQALEFARRLMDFNINDLARLRSIGYVGDCLPYSSGAGAGTVAAVDLAGFFVWPALVLWQETGDEKYRTFAEGNMLCASRGEATDQIKQWNQTYSYLAQGYEALVAIAWR